MVVTGIGAITPLGSTFAETWQCVQDPKNVKNNGGITSLESALKAQQLTEEQMDREWSIAKHLPCQVAAAVQYPILPMDVRTGRFVQLTLLATKEATTQAQLQSLLGLSEDDSIIHENRNDGQGAEEAPRNIRERIGSCIGTGMSGVRDITNASLALYNPSDVPPSKRIRTISPHFVPKLLPNSASGRISVLYRLGGPVLAPATACAASAHAIGDAFRCIQYNDADIMIAGGAESCIDPISMAGFCRLRAMSTNFNDTPLLASRPFDSQRDGFVMAEGAAVLVLEERQHALQRGVPILCELVGYGLAGDGYHITSPDVNGHGAERAMRAAIRGAGLTMAQVDYINAHATSTPMGDGIEASTIARIAREHSSSSSSNSRRIGSLLVSSTKGASGHLLGAAGALEASFACMAIHDGVVPPTWNLDEKQMEGIDSFELVKTSKKASVNVALSNSFGFGGTNASLLFKKHQL